MFVPCAVVGVAMIAAAPGYGSLSAPVLNTPLDGAAVDNLPVFTWNGVSGAAKYEFQLAGTSAFSPALVDVTTANHRAATSKVLGNQTYYWRVRAISSTGTNGPWSAVRSFDHEWSDVATPQSPGDGDTLTYPDPILLNWSSVPGAQKYEVKIATDSNLSSLVGGYPTATNPTETAASAYSPVSRLAPGTYYWDVTPIDAEGHEGTPSPTWSFTWNWNVSTTLSVTDLDPADEVYDPQFSWTPIAGAAYYQVEVNSDPNWASGSKVCCSGYSVGTSLTPTKLLPADTYYWRVRPYDASRNPGAWTQYTDSGSTPQDTFTIAYDVDQTSLGGPASVQNLTVLDSSANPIAWSPGGISTDTPIIGWDPVPGASHYEVDVTPFASGSCNWTATGLVQWDDFTASTYWTPLGNSWNLVKPFNDAHNHTVAQDSITALTTGGNYCARVRAERSADTNGHVIYGDWTYIGPSDGSDFAFTFSGYPAGGSCSPSCSPNYLGSGDYLLPANSSSNQRMPLFTWNPLSGKQSYFVIVATDPSFQNVVDYAFTKIPAYAPRTNTSTVTTYPDTASLYYWAVLPATNANGSGAVGDPVNSAAKHNFQKQSIAPSLLTPADGDVIGTQPTFQWTPAEGAAYYHLQVSTDPQFGTTVEDVGATSSSGIGETSYTSDTNYPAATTLYWRVQAVDAGGRGLSYSSIGTFQKTLAVPTFDTVTNDTAGGQIPTFKWDPVAGAVSYDVDFNCPTSGGSCQDSTNIDTTAVAPLALSGVGGFTWRVRANFPTVGASGITGTIHGGYTSLQTFDRTITAPANVSTSYGGPKDFSFTWDPKLTAKTYSWEVSTSSTTTAGGSFATILESGTTETTGVAPLLYNHLEYTNGGTLYWQVAAKDADGNLGAFSAAQTLALPVLIKVTASPLSILKKTTTTVTVYTKDAHGHNINGATVRASGAGITPVTKTSTSGKAVFKLHPTKAGKITFTASESSYQTGTVTISVG
ncbi:MAG TPA: hypothetical protein VE777_21785 [Gaiellales bacterium]|nr:hypothetical protein [Gaiellales bacterium]